MCLEKRGYGMIANVMNNGFSALAAYMFIFTMVMVGLFVVAVIANAFTKKSKFNTDEIRKVLLYNLWFMTLFAVLDYFLIP